MRKIFPLLVFCFLALLVLFQIGRTEYATVTNAISPGTIRSDATYEHIGVLWWINGDDDLDSSLNLEFRPLGATTWTSRR